MLRSPPFRVGARPRPERRGAILLVVLTLLALFAVIGLSFVLYSEREANAARIHKEAGDLDPASVLPDITEVANATLAQVLYPTNDAHSALHGHDLQRLKYGGAGGAVAFNGLGQVYEPLGAVPPFTTRGVTLNRNEVMNYTLWVPTRGSNTNNVKVDPENTFGDGRLRVGANALTDALGPVYVGKNAPYTYPDVNNALVAVQDPATGRVVATSGMRPSFGSLAPDGANWFLDKGRFLTLRPRQIDHLLASEIAALPAGLFPVPATLTPAQAGQLAALSQQGRLGQFPALAKNASGTYTGDVANLKFMTGSQDNDSFWMDLNLPLFRYKGRILRPLVAPILLPLDGRVNVNVAGGILDPDATTKLIREGFGPQEIDLSAVFGSTNALANARALVTKRHGGAFTAPQPLALPASGNQPTEYTVYPTKPTIPVSVAHQVFQPLDSTGSARVVTLTGMDSRLDVRQRIPSGSGDVEFNANFSNATARRLSIPGQGTPTAGQQMQSDATSTSVATTSYQTYDEMTMMGHTGDVLAHPTQFNPYHRQRYGVGGAATGVGVFPPSDLRRTGASYSVRNTLISTQTVIGAASSFNAEFDQTLPNHFANVVRARTTTLSNSNKRPGLSPNFTGDANTRFIFPLTAGVTRPYTAVGPSGTTTAASPRLDLSATVGSGLQDVTTPAPNNRLISQAAKGASDIDLSGSSTALTATDPRNVRNLRAALSAVDLNRILKDYRVDPAQPLTAPSNVTVASDQAARLDRQAFATEIFHRLAVATGAAVRYDASLGRYVLPKPVTPTPEGPYEIEVTGVAAADRPRVTAPEYDALRFLAQYAANVVDALDVDDISTPFVWNPLDAADPQAAGNFESAAIDSMSGSPFLNNRVVFGVEKTRLVLNEVYGELANASADVPTPPQNAQKPFQARFFFELLNPTSTDNNSPLPQNVPLSNGTSAIYKLKVYDDQASVVDALNVNNLNHANVIGVPTAQPKIDFNLVGLTGTAAADNANSTSSVEPNDGHFKANDAANPNTRRGFAVIGPQLNPADATTDNVAFIPDTATAPYNLMLTKALTAPNMPAAPEENRDEPAYYVNKGMTDADITTTGEAKTQIDKAHAVLLQRLANPYVAYAAASNTTNPYVTVDAKLNVKLHDAVKKAAAPGMMPGTRMTPPMAQNNASLGRVQPYTAFQEEAAAGPFTGPTGTLADSLVLKQAPTPAETTKAQTTFFRHNSQADYSSTATPLASPGDANLVYPFEWMPHLDRRMVSQEELLNVPTVPAHEVTYAFARPAGAGVRPTFHQQTMRPLAYDAQSPLYRALELLTVKPWTHDTPEGGRVAGKVNVNLIWDEAVFNAAFPLADGGLTAAERTAMWTALKNSRTPGFPAVAATRDETGGATADRPFKSFGAPQFSARDLADPADQRNVAPGAATDFDETLLRQVPDPADPAKRVPLFSRLVSTRAAADLVDDPLHPTKDNAPLRRALNSVTTTSDTFLLVFTVGYFEVRNRTDVNLGNLTTDPIVLGQEMFNNVPGDLRSQFCAVLDRSNMATTPPAAGAPPWVAELQNNATGAATNLTTQVQMALNVPRYAGPPAWDGTGDPPAGAETQYVQDVAGRAPLSPGGAQEFYVTPIYQRSGGTVFPVGNPNRRLTMAVQGAYEPRGPGDFYALTSEFNPNLPISATNPTGTPFAVGVGQSRVEVQAYYDGTAATQWTYDPLNGRTRLTVRVTSGTLPNVPAGTLLSNVEFGAPSVIPSPNSQVPDSVMPYFGRLTR